MLTAPIGHDRSRGWHRDGETPSGSSPSPTPSQLGRTFPHFAPSPPCLSTFTVCVSFFTLSVDAGELTQTTPRDIQRVVADGKHNAFTALVRWKTAYWLSFRKATAHGSHDGDLVVLRSSDAKKWRKVLHLNVLPDDRDPQLLATKKRLFLYDPARKGGVLTSFVTYTDDGKMWSEPRQVYDDHSIFWKPVAHGGKLYATAHVSSSDGKARQAHLITSKDGLAWKKISKIRGGNWESETTIHFGADGKLVAFLRQIRGSPPSAILESRAPYTEWTGRSSTRHLSGHAVYTFDHTTYLLSRTRNGGKNGTMVYVYEKGKLLPYCKIPSGGDCSYPAAVRIADEMLISYYSSHEGSTNIYTCRVSLRRK